jgi:threonine/homoserine/homoserine lactone efflux protein
MAASLWAGAALGFSVSVPLGPISLLCIQNTLAGGFAQGVITGLGAATAQGLFASAAILGAGIAAAVLAPWTDVIRCFSAALLMVLGIRILLRHRAGRLQGRTTSWRASYASTLVLALSNPMTILPYIAVATADVEDMGFSTWLVLGVILAALSWYATLCGIASVMRRRIPGHVAVYLNMVAGGAMIAFALVIVTGRLHL